MAQAQVDENGSTTELTSKEKKKFTELRRDKRRLDVEVELQPEALPFRPGSRRRVGVASRMITPVGLGFGDLLPCSVGRAAARLAA